MHASLLCAYLVGGGRCETRKGPKMGGIEL